ncbi:MAG: hypothetical protein ACTHLO_06675 [Pseudolabrys sp.]
MRAILAAAIVLAGITAASAKPSPVDVPRLTPAPADLAIAVGAAGAMMESDYFQAPQPQYSSRGMSVCRLHTEVFSKMRMAQACE